MGLHSANNLDNSWLDLLMFSMQCFLCVLVLSLNYITIISIVIKSFVFVVLFFLCFLFSINLCNSFPFLQCR